MPDTGSRDALLPVRAVMKRTGLTADVLRAWERRYAAVEPIRSAGGQRLYSENDVAKLVLLRRAAAAGHSIAEVAKLELSALEALIETPALERHVPPPHAVEKATADALEAAMRFDRTAIEQTLRRFALGHGMVALVDYVIGPLLQTVGERWHAGTLSPAHEHLASKAVGAVLNWALDSFSAGPRAPRLIVTTPSGELHELGALLVAAAASEETYRVVYLGPNLPHRDIIDAAERVSARAICVSLINVDNASALGEARALARLAPRGMTVFAGGRAALVHEKKLTAAGARVIAELPSFRRALRNLRSGHNDE